MSERRLVSIFRSSRKEELYLYVDRQKGLDGVPEELLERFGKPTLVMHLMLDGERKLARVQASEVLKSIAARGYFVQLPPPPDPEMQRVVLAREQAPAMRKPDEGAVDAE